MFVFREISGGWGITANQQQFNHKHAVKLSQNLSIQEIISNYVFNSDSNNMLEVLSRGLFLRSN